jgi:hypothetical protein
MRRNIFGVERLELTEDRRNSPPISNGMAFAAKSPRFRPALDPDPTITVEDFDAYMPAHAYIFGPTRELWPGASVDSRIPPQPVVDVDGNPVLDKDGKPKTIKASRWLDQNKPVEQMTWAPGEPPIVAGRLISEGGWIDKAGCRCLNLYRAPVVTPGDAGQAGLWIDHVQNVYGVDAHHIVQWLAHRVQRPHQKINHALVLGGGQGIGKDTLLEPVKTAIGPWNFIEVSPQNVLGRFNGFLKSVILRISEARDLGDVNRFAFYDHMKAYTAAPPDVLRVDEKHLREYAVFNVCGVIITSNHKSDGIFIPADDRRHFVAWSNLTKDDFDASYWTNIWSWYGNGGIGHVAAYLRELDISAFNPKAPPPKTTAWWDIVSSSRSPEDAELADILDEMNNPKVTTLAELIGRASEGFAQFLSDLRNRRKFAHRMESCGYEPLRNGDANDGLWKVNGKRQVIYAQKDLSTQEKHVALQARYSSAGR